MNIIQRMKNMLLHPRATWDVIANEPGGVLAAIVPYAAVLELIPSLLMLSPGAIGFGLPGMSQGFGGFSLTMAPFAALLYVITLASLVVVSGLMTWIAPVFRTKKSWTLACRVLVYAGTPIYLSHVVGFIPSIGSLLMIASLLWGLFLLYQGIGQVLHGRGARQLLMTISVVILYGVIAGTAIRLAYLVLPEDRSTDVSMAADPTGDQPPVISEEAQLDFQARMAAAVTGQNLTEEEMQQLRQHLKESQAMWKQVEQEGKKREKDHAEETDKN